MSLPRVILSLTSYPARIDTVAQAIKPLLRQTVPADCIQLWLAKDEFEAEPTALPESLLELEEAGLAIMWCERSLKPHTKYFWAIKENPQDIIITVDDDIIYPLTLVQDLLAMHYRNPGAIISNRTHMILRDELGQIIPYSDWVFAQSEYCGVERGDLIATGVGGVLYPPNIFDAEALDESLVRETSLMADDLWLLVQELRLGIPIVSTGTFKDLLYISGTQEDGLCVDNLFAGRNDEILRTLFDHYPAVKEALVQKVRQREIKQVPSELDVTVSDRPRALRKVRQILKDVHTR